MDFDEIIQLVRDKGHRLTAARQHVIRVLSTADNYLGAYDIHHILQQKKIHIGVASIYRVLELLNTLGLLKREEFGSGGDRFRLVDKTGHHAHEVICSQCGRTEEFRDCPLLTLTKSLENRSGYHIQEHWLKFIGICPECLKQKGISF